MRSQGHTCRIGRASQTNAGVIKLLDKDDVIDIRYGFWFEDGRKLRFRLSLDPHTMQPVRDLPKRLPDWTKMEFHRCSGCPLDAAEHPHCPAAARLHPVVDKMRDVVSTEQVKVAVASLQRTVIRKTSVQEGLSSLMGMIMATSGCPRTGFFRPMARFHLPFADLDETTYRAASTYMLAQHFRASRGQDADLSMQGLHRLYEQVNEVNHKMAERLRCDEREDGAINAIVILDMFAKGLPPQFDALLDELGALFGSFLDAVPARA
jgi:hypothetical protein